MDRVKWRALLIVLPILLSLWFLFPTLQWILLSPEQRAQKESANDPLLKKILNLGLDLRGGSHLVLELEDEKVVQGEGEDKKAAVRRAVEQAIEILRNRVDQFGVAEPLIARQGEKWIVIQLPGIKDPERAKQLIGKTAQLEFRLVDDSPALQNIATAVKEKNISLSSAAQNPELLPKEILSLFPTGYVLLPGKGGAFFLVKSTPELTGATLKNAKVQFGGNTGFGYPEVGIEFNEEGASIFSRVTETNINRNLAIVLDGIVQSAPVIRTRIPDGRAVIEGQFSEEDAKLLATVLRAGALPAPVKIIEERTVGPTLGEDSIRAGVNACIIGMALLSIFVSFYYKRAGVITVLALFLNLLLLLGVLAYFHATLTLPGIAGIVLTVGMAVDANVLILERIREELKLGRSVRLAVDQGYQKAFSTILDSNLTTFIAAVFLFQFGTGPVKGFAVSLITGLCISMFTAIFATKTYYEWRLRDKAVTSLSI